MAESCEGGNHHIVPGDERLGGQQEVRGRRRLLLEKSLEGTRFEALFAVTCLALFFFFGLIMLAFSLDTSTSMFFFVYLKSLY